MALPLRAEIVEVTGATPEVRALDTNTTLLITGRRDAADAGVDVVIRSNAVRVAGQVFAIRNTVTDLITVDFAGATVIDYSGTGDAVQIQHGGAGDALNIALDGVDIGAQAIVVTETAVARTAIMMSLTRDAAVVSGTAHVLEIDNNGAGNAIDINQGGLGDGLNINLDGTSTSANAIVVTENGFGRTATLVSLTRTSAASATASALFINNDGAGDSIDINHAGDGNALDIALDGASPLSQAIVVTETAVARLVVMMSLTRDAAVVSGAAHVLEIDNNGAGNAIDINQGGVGDGLNINLDGTSTFANAIVVTETAVARSAAMMSLTRDALTTVTAHALQITQPGAGDAINVVSGRSFFGGAVTTSATLNVNSVLDSGLGFGDSIGLGPGVFLQEAGTAFLANAPGVGVAIAVPVAEQILILDPTLSFGVLITPGGGAATCDVTEAPGVGSSGGAFAITGGAHTALLNFERIDVAFNLNRTVQWTGNITLAEQRAFVIRPPTYTSDTATKTITTAVTAEITGAPVAGLNLDITNPVAFRVVSGVGDAVNILLDSTDINSQAIVVTETAVARTAAMMSLTRAVGVTSATAHVLAIANSTGFMNAIDINQGSAGDAIGIFLGPEPANQAIVVTESASARTTVMMSLTRDALATATAHVLQITNPGAGRSIDVVSGDVFFAGNLDVAGVSAFGSDAALDADVVVNVRNTFGDTDVSSEGIDVLVAEHRTTAPTTAVLTGTLSRATIDAANDQNWTTTVGLRGVSARVTTTAVSTGAITGAAAFHAQSGGVAGATIDFLYGMRIEAQTAGTTDNYGIFIDTPSGGATRNDAIHVVGGRTLLGGALAHTGTSIGLYSAAVVAQHTSTGQTAGFVAGAGSAVLDDSTFTGGTGTAAYTIGDVVRAIKLIGIMAAS